MRIHIMRRSTVSVMVLAGCVAVGLFQVKYKVVAMEDRLKAIHAQIRQEKETIHLLKAEWAYLNEPKRLQELCDKYLPLQSVKSTQIASMDVLNQMSHIKVARHQKRSSLHHAPIVRTVSHVE